MSRRTEAKKDGGRAARLEGAILSEIADVVQRGVKDPRVHGAGLVTFTRVMLNPDLRVAKVFVSFMGAKEEAVQGALTGLKAAAGYLRGEVGRRLGLKNTPELRFVHDTTADHVAHIERLLRGDE